MSNKRLPWFRMYTDFLNDPKLIALAFEDQRHFIGVLALKADGVVDDTCEENLLNRIVAQRLWIDHAVIRDVKKRLVDAGLIDSHWQPLAWNKRQFTSDRDSTATERKRRERAAKSTASHNVTDASRVTSRTHGANVTRLDTDTDTESPLPPCGGESDLPVGIDQQPVPATFPAIDEPDAQAAVTPATHPAVDQAPAAPAALAAPVAMVVVQPTQAGIVCRAMKAAGVPNPNPSSQRLLGLIAAGADVNEFIAAASKAAAKPRHDAFAYALTCMESERTQAADTAPRLHKGALPGSASATEEAYQNLLRGAI